MILQPGNTKEYSRTVDLLFDWIGLVCFANINKNCHLSFQISQTGGLWYSDTSPFSIPCLYFKNILMIVSDDHK
jgi:hypothetical protein